MDKDKQSVEDVLSCLNCTYPVECCTGVRKHCRERYEHYLKKKEKRARLWHEGKKSNTKRGKRDGIFHEEAETVCKA